jgi:hypothetical protein
MQRPRPGAGRGGTRPGRRAVPPAPGDVGGEAARRGEEEVPGAAGRIDDGEPSSASAGALPGVGLAMVSRDDGLQRAVEQHLHEAVGRVVAAGGLAGVALGLVARGEAERRAHVARSGHQLQQALVHAAELLRPHVAPVHPGERSCPRLAQPRQLEQRQQQGTVLQAGGIERRALAGGEQPAKAGSPRRGSPRPPSTQDDLWQRPSHRSAWRSWALRRTANARAGAQGVALGVQRGAAASLVPFGMQEVALLHGEQEDQAIDEPQELLGRSGTPDTARTACACDPPRQRPPPVCPAPRRAAPRPRARARRARRGRWGRCAPPRPRAPSA